MILTLFELALNHRTQSRVDSLPIQDPRIHTPLCRILQRVFCHGYTLTPPCSQIVGVHGRPERADHVARTSVFAEQISSR